MQMLNPKRGEDPRSTRELFNVAVTKFPKRKSWDAIRELHKRASREVLDRAIKLCNSQNSLKRAVGVHILAQIGYGRKKFLRETVPVLIEKLQDFDQKVVRAAAIGLGHRNDARAIPHLVALKGSPNGYIRYCVVFGLCCHDDPVAIDALIELSRDRVRDVRDYATFGLAELTQLDTPKLRYALAARLKEKDAEIRGQALAGLAQRKDERAIKPLLHELRGKFYGTWAAEAAGAFANPVFLSPLKALRKRVNNLAARHHLDVIDAAIILCDPTATGRQKTNARRTLLLPI